MCCMRRTCVPAWRRAGSRAAPPRTEKRVRNRRVEMTGVPLRDGFEPRTAAVPPRRLLVTGGSQGARHINEAVWAALDELRKRFEEVVHIAGPQGSAGVAEHASPGYRGLSFTDDMPVLMAEADLVVSRAGVSTIARLTTRSASAINTGM